MSVSYLDKYISNRASELYTLYYYAPNERDVVVIVYNCTLLWAVIIKRSEWLWRAKHGCGSLRSGGEQCTVRTAHSRELDTLVPFF